MSRIDFEIMRAVGDLDSIEGRLERAMQSVARRTLELTDAVTRKVGITCYASNLSSAVSDVTALGGERESLVRLVETLKSLKDGTATVMVP